MFAGIRNQRSVSISKSDKIEKPRQSEATGDRHHRYNKPIAGRAPDQKSHTVFISALFNKRPYLLILSGKSSVTASANKI